MKLLVKVTGNLPVRWGAGINFGVRKNLKTGDEVTVIKEENGWYYLSDASGWIYKQYTKLLKNLDPTGSTSKTNTSATQKTAKSGTGKAAKESTADRNISKALTDYIPLKYDTYRYAVDTNFVDDNMDVIRQNLNITHADTYKDITDALFRSFNRHKTPFPDSYLSKSFSHVFFTRPDLNIIKSLGKGNYELHAQFKNDPVFYNAWESNWRLMMALTSAMNTGHDFHPFLSSAAESFELSDEFIKTVEHGETLTGYKIKYGKHNIESNSAGSFSVNYTEDNRGSIYWTHKIWMEYISKVYRGEASPTQINIRKKILDYASSAYYFLVGPDGETIIFWAKYFGVFPTSTPSSAFSWAKGNNVKLPSFSINYDYSFKEDANPLSLAEFNMNSRTNLVYKPIYEPENLSTGRTLSGAPFVDTVKGGPRGYQHKLRFRKA